MTSSSALSQRTYSVADVARIFGVTPSHVWRLCQKGDIPSIRLGSRILIPREVVEHILASTGGEESEEGVKGEL